MQHVLQNAPAPVQPGIPAGLEQTLQGVPLILCHSDFGQKPLGCRVVHSQGHRVRGIGGEEPFRRSDILVKFQKS